MGIVEGGWEFVWSAYGLTAAGLFSYAVSVFLRLRTERGRAEREAKHIPEVSS